jgi:eukaryotic-like serine/threonine-protein kinase
MKTKRCLVCGVALPVPIHGGLCPACALRGALMHGAEETHPDPDRRLTGSPNVALPVEGGQRFGDYELIEEIAHGGMGVVYRARQLTLDRVVGLKMLLPGLSSPEYLRRFRTEASAAAGLQHPNIVAIHEVGVCHGRQYLVMDCVEGQSLAEVIRDRGLGSVDFPQCARWMKAVSEAVQHAHAHGILHRDLKPSNVLIDALGQPKVTDFGLAKRFEAESQMTLSGQLLGSPSYMPPEQAEARRGKVSRRSDVYGLGATLYHLLTGRALFQGETPTEVLHQVLNNDPVAPRLLNPGIPQDLETICLKCIEKDPARRYPTARAVAEDLGRFLEDKPIMARPISAVGRSWRWCRRKPVVASLTAGLAFTIVLGFAGVLWQWQRAESERYHRQHQAYASDMKAAHAALQEENCGLAVSLLRRHFPRRGQEDLRGIEWRYLWQLSQGDESRAFAHPGRVNGASISPDELYLATSCLDQRIRIWQTDSGKVIEQFTAGGSLGPKTLATFSPDGKWLAMRGERGIEIRDTTNWSLLKELTGIHPKSSPICISADSRILVSGVTNGLGAWHVADWTCRVLTTHAVAVLFNLAVSSDGSLVAYSPATPLFNVHGPIVLWRPEEGTTCTLARDQDVNALAISPDGRWLASGHYSGEVCLWELASLQPIRTNRFHRVGVLGLAFSHDGAFLASSGNDQLIHLWAMGTDKPFRTLRGHQAEVYGLGFSRNGRLLSSASKDGTARIWQIQRLDSRSSAFSLPHGAVPVGPARDGRSLLTIDRTNTTVRRWRLPDGELLAADKWDRAAQVGCEVFRVLPRNGLAAGVTSNGTVHLWDLESGVHRKQIPLGGSAFMPQSLSPDQRWLTGIVTNQPDTFLQAGVPIEAGMILCDLRTARKVPDFVFTWSWAFGAVFSPDSRWLAYSHSREGGNALVIWDLLSGRPRQTLGIFNDPIGVLAFSPDGEKLVSGHWSGELRVWSAQTGQLLLPPLSGHVVGVGRLAFSADGKTLASSGGDRSVRLWSVATGQELIFLRDCWMLPGDELSIADFYLASQADLTPGDRWFVWREGSGTIRVMALPALAGIDAIER